MLRIRFKEFLFSYFEPSDKVINAWLDANPGMQIIKWSAISTGDRRQTRIIIQYIEDYYTSSN